MTYLKHGAVVFLIALCGCMPPRNATTPDTTTQGDPKNAPNYGYTPIDPLPINFKFLDDSTTSTGSTVHTSIDLLNALPDETVRLAIGQFDAQGSVAFGPASLGVSGGSYVVVLDYIKFTTLPQPITTMSNSTGEKNYRRASQSTTSETSVPVYVGVGLRLTANVTVKRGSVNLGNLIALGIAAQSNKITGTLVVQTLGISGEGISANIPMPSDINQTSIQNAIQALGTIKANIYSGKTIINPRVVGIYNNLGGGAQTVNRFISQVLDKPIPVTIRHRLLISER